MRLVLAAVAAATLAVAVPAPIYAQAGMTAGMQVTDPSGAAVGTVKAVQGTNLLVNTGTHEALLPASSFTVSNGKLLFGMTKAQLDAQIEQSLAKASAAIAPGAAVKGTAGTPVGTIDAVAEGKVTLTLQNGKKIAVPQEGFRGNPDGTVTIGYTAEQLEAIVQGGTAPDAK